jgi:hypothetical protein
MHALRSTALEMYRKLERDIQAENTTALEATSITTLQHELVQVENITATTTTPVTSNVDRSRRTALCASQAPRVSANAVGQFTIREIRCWQCGKKHHLKDCRKATDAQKKALYDKHKAERAKALQRQPQPQNGHRGSPRRPAFVPRRPPREGANNAQSAEQHDTPAGEQQTERKSDTSTRAGTAQDNAQTNAVRRVRHTGATRRPIAWANHVHKIHGAQAHHAVQHRHNSLVLPHG